MPVLFITHGLGEEGTEIESRLEISRFQMFRSASVFFNNEELILYAVESVNLRWASFCLILNLSVQFCFCFYTQLK